MGNPCLKWSNNRLLNKCKMQSIYHMITEQVINYIHKLQVTQTPQALYNMYNIPNCPQRTNVHLHPKYTPRTKHLKSSIFFKFSAIYTYLPDSIKTLPINKFKKQIEIHIQTNFSPYSLPQTHNESESDSD